ncbi:hypothetical protein BDA96_06G234300 [Sorghum bicolor]|uniref:Uncharacterized protein n=1 Tax=Sorghum bicolor TaxID=4558 RepID=A0A921QTL0_SORBI|nr:hypothetical protein BDA96_06G234300 [Sorghum bicolor]
MEMDQTEHHVRCCHLLAAAMQHETEDAGEEIGLNSARIWQVPQGMCVKLRLQVTRSAHQISSVSPCGHACPSAPSEKRSPQHHYALITAPVNTLSHWPSQHAFCL